MLSIVQAVMKAEKVGTFGVTTRDMHVRGLELWQRNDGRSVLSFIVRPTRRHEHKTLVTSSDVLVHT